MKTELIQFLVFAPVLFWIWHGTWHTKVFTDLRKWMGVRDEI